MKSVSRRYAVGGNKRTWKTDRVKSRYLRDNTRIKVALMTKRKPHGAGHCKLLPRAVSKRHRLLVRKARAPSTLNPTW